MGREGSRPEASQADPGRRPPAVLPGPVRRATWAAGQLPGQGPPPPEGASVSALIIPFLETAHRRISASDRLCKGTRGGAAAVSLGVTGNSVTLVREGKVFPWQPTERTQSEALGPSAVVRKCSPLPLLPETAPGASMGWTVCVLVCMVCACVCTHVSRVLACVLCVHVCCVHACAICMHAYVLRGCLCV